MKLNKVKRVIMEDKFCCIEEVEPDNNMIAQWIAGVRALYPVRGFRVDLNTLQAVWEVDGETWADITYSGGCGISENVLTEVPECIDADHAPDNVVGRINGWMLVQDEDSDRLWCVDEALLTPCMAKKEKLHLIPVKDEPWMLVYTGNILSGVVQVAGNKKCEELIGWCGRIGGMRSAVTG